MTIQCMVGDRLRLVDDDVFIAAFSRLSQLYGDLGLEGDRLDLAIAEELPHRLAHMLDGDNVVALRTD